MIALDRDQAPVQMIAGMYDQIYASLYRNMLPIYVGQYRIFADAQVMPVKVIWDYTFYWGIMCPLFIQNRLTRPAEDGPLQAELARIEKLNVAVQPFMRAWSQVTGPRPQSAAAARSGVARLVCRHEPGPDRQARRCAVRRPDGGVGQGPRRTRGRDRGTGDGPAS